MCRTGNSRQGDTMRQGSARGAAARPGGARALTRGGQWPRPSYPRGVEHHGLLVRCDLDRELLLSRAARVVPGRQGLFDLVPDPGWPLLDDRPAVAAAGEPGVGPRRGLGQQGLESDSVMTDLDTTDTGGGELGEEFGGPVVEEVGPVAGRADVAVMWRQRGVERRRGVRSG